MRLKMKGLEEEPEVLEDYDDLAAGLRLASRKKLGPFAREDRERDPQKDMAALARAGFSYDVVSKVMAMDRAEADDIMADADF